VEFNEEFELSKLPVLFKRLPDDRYRIYLIEDGTARLVLDFLIRDGRPVEAPEDAGTEPGDGADDAAPGAESEMREGIDTDTMDDPGDATNAGASVRRQEAAVPAHGRPPTEQFRQANARELTSNPRSQEFAQRLGSMAYISQGTAILTTSMLGLTTHNGREKLIDQVIRRIGNGGAGDLNLGRLFRS
jgi:hypothetical protein